MTIGTPGELGVGKPLIGSNHIHFSVGREGDETSMLVERNCLWLLATTIEQRDVMALVSERLKPIVVGVGDDDSTLVGDAQSLRIFELAWLSAERAELEQERAVDRRQYLHSIVVGIRDDDSVSILIDRNVCWPVELSRSRASLAANGEQEREIDRRQEHQSMVVGVGDDGATMMLVDRNALRTVELEIP